MSLASELFEYWQGRCEHPHAKFTAERRKKIEARLKDGYTVEQIRQAIDGAAHGAFVSDTGKRFDDIELICRNGTKLESFMDRAGVAGIRRHESLNQMDAWKQYYRESA